jgi:signal transduction histidine kinase
MIDRMTDARVPAPERLPGRLRSPVVQLNLVGIVLVGATVLTTHPRGTGTADVVLGVVALAGWAVWALRLPGRGRDTALLVGALASAVGTGLGAAWLLAPLIAGLLVAISDITHRVPALATFVAAAAVAMTVAASASGMDLGDLVSLLAGIAVGALGGVTRRQRRFADVQQQDLLASTLAAEREAQRVQLLEARSAAARDVHDVLAHSLGGLVLQLDAIEALLEHGRVGEAATRASAARALAAEGLTEARRAVAALRDPGATAPVAIREDALQRLLAAHRALGAAAETTGDPSLSGVDQPHREALAGALREALVNARRHAPGSTVRVGLEREAHAMMLHVENPLPTASEPSVGGGQGLAGMRERFAALGDGSSASARVERGMFVVEARAVLA